MDVQPLVVAGMRSRSCFCVISKELTVNIQELICGGEKVVVRDFVSDFARIAISAAGEQNLKRWFRL
jgi:hypothetical protein